jgi:hypothetical protein
MTAHEWLLTPPQSRVPIALVNLRFKVCTRTLHWVSIDHEYITVSQWNAIANETLDNINYQVKRHVMRQWMLLKHAECTDLQTESAVVESIPSNDR